MEETKRASEAAAAAQQQQQGQGQAAGGAAQGTPDYAAGLTAMNPPTPAPATPSYTPAVAAPAVAAVAPTPQPSEPATSQVVEAPTTTAPSYVPLVVTATIQSPVTPPAAQQPAVAATTAPAAAVAAPVQPKQVFQVRPMAPMAQIRLQPVGAAGANSAQHKGRLSLTREQMLEAQDMFRTANRVTRPEKALILGFMAGARDNPCPDLGNVVTIKLSENQENILQADQTYLTMLVETHFQMNYNTGEWKRIKKLRKLDDPSGGPLPSIATLAAAAAAATIASATAT